MKKEGEEQRYHLSWDMRPHKNDPVTKAKLEKLQRGGCDAALFHSIIYPPDGGRSEHIFSINGKTGDDLPMSEWFKSWVMLAHGLMDQESLKVWQRELAASVFHFVQMVTVGEERVMEMDGLGPMAARARLRPPGFDQLPTQAKWEVDKQLGILDWDGDPKK